MIQTGLYWKTAKSNYNLNLLWILLIRFYVLHSWLTRNMKRTDERLSKKLFLNGMIFLWIRCCRAAPIAASLIRDAYPPPSQSQWVRTERSWATLLPRGTGRLPSGKAFWGMLRFPNRPPHCSPDQFKPSWRDETRTWDDSAGGKETWEKHTRYHRPLDSEASLLPFPEWLHLFSSHSVGTRALRKAFPLMSPATNAEVALDGFLETPRGILRLHVTWLDKHEAQRTVQICAFVKICTYTNI